MRFLPGPVEVFGEDGIRTIYGMTGREAAPLLAKAIAELGHHQAASYWEYTQGNAGSSLVNLLVLATLLPDAVFYGD